MTLPRRWAAVLASGLVFVTVAVVAAPAAYTAVNGGTDAAGLQIDSTDVSTYPEIRLEVSTPVAVDQDAVESVFTLTEDGEERPVSATQLDSRDVETILLIDTSGSMRGEPIAAAREAAAAFVGRLPDDARVALVGFGGEVTVLAPFSAGRTATKAAIEKLIVSGETALYDGVVTALEQFSADDEATGRSIVLLSDGGDTASLAPLEGATRALAAAGVRLHAIELQSPENDPRSLARLASATDGEVTRVGDAAGLDAVYASIASRLVNRFELTYDSEAHGATPVRVEMAGQDGTAVAEHQLTLPVAPVPAEAPAPTAETVPAGGMWSNVLVLAASALALFLGLFVLSYTVLGARVPRVRLSAARGNAMRAWRPSHIGTLADHVTALAEQQLERHGWQRSLNAALEQAGIDLRPAEYVVLAACAVTTALGVGLVMVNAVIGIVFGLLAALASKLLLSVLTSRRREAFAEQLGDTLQLLAGSLRAGYGLLQAIDSVGREADRPSADEFGRIVVESRLGRDLDDSLDAMAERMDSEDFAWVVQAVEIHREVGGDLAQVLDTVAATIRERNQIRRQIKALSAEGRYSAYVLIALPFFVAGIISLTTPSYLAELTSTFPGIVMLMVALVLVGLGALWLRKLTRLVF